MDISKTIEPRSDQLNAEDLLTGPQTVTIVEVRPGSLEQPVEIVLAEYGPRRPFKPSKTVRRILVLAWGPDTTPYRGRRMTLYRDPEVRFGGEAVGGIRVSALSHIDGQRSFALTVTKGRRQPFRVEPLPPLPSVEQLRERWRQTEDLALRKVIEAQVQALTPLQEQTPAPTPDPDPSPPPTDEQPDDVEHDPTVEADWPGEPLDGQK